MVGTRTPGECTVLGTNPSLLSMVFIGIVEPLRRHQLLLDLHVPTTPGAPLPTTVSPPGYPRLKKSFFPKLFLDRLGC